MRFFIVGMGRAGSSLFFSLKENGAECCGYHSLRKQEDIEAAFFPDLSDVPYVDVAFFTLPDSLIEPVSKSFPRDRVGVFAHLSGSLPSSVFQGEGVLSIHPMVSIGMRKFNLTGISWVVEGDRKGIEIAREMVDLLKGRLYRIGPRNKPLYHAGCIIATNLILSLLSYVGDIFSNLGIEEEEASRMADSVLKNIRKLGMENAHTGPIERGDWEVLKADLLALDKKYPFLFKNIAGLFLLEAHRVSMKRGKEYEENVLDIISYINSHRK